MKRLLAAALVVAAISAIPSPVAAATVCNYTASTHEVDVGLVGSVIVTISRDGAGHIKVNNTWCDGAATVTNTRHITVNGGLGSQSLTIDLANNGFKPGFGNEPGKSDEIEFSINLGADHDALSFMGTGKADKIDLGQNNAVLVPVRRINLNSGESTGVDADVTASGMDIFVVQGKGGNDVIRGRGLRGTGPDPITIAMRVQAGNGDDIVKGGDSGDELHGDYGKDQVWGFGAVDSLRLADGEAGDVGYGGAAVDTCLCDPGDTFIQYQ
jgi:hypothetical protein